MLYRLRRFRNRLSFRQAQADAAAAAATAKTASGNASTASTAATEAVANLATVQTGATSAALAKEAADYADKAMAAYEYAKKASEDAAAAEDVTAAVEARFKAEMAMADAVSYGTTATDKAGEAETASHGRAYDRRHGQDRRRYGSRRRRPGPATVTTNGDAVITGLIEDLNPDHTVLAMTVGVEGEDKSAADAVDRRMLSPTRRPRQVWRHVCLISARWLIRRTTWPA